MKSTYKNSQKTLNTDHWEKIDYDLIVYGTKNLRKQLTDTISAALCRYMENKGIGTRKLSRLTGIPKGTVSRYRHGTAKYNPDYLYAICIALRLRTCRQRHLFTLLEKDMPDERGKDRSRAYIIREFLDGCFYDESYMVAACNERLIATGAESLTSLFPQKEVK